jgi:hypothetical protein
MASRILNRRELREQADHAGQLDAGAADVASAGVPSKQGAKRKAVRAPRAKKPRKAKPRPRLRARWGIFDAGMKQVAIFDYNQRAAADEKLADLLAKRKGIHFLQIVKEPMPEPAPVEAPVGE